MSRSPRGELGVDLNRNYGYKWGLDDQGSVADPCDEIYRGGGPFSEPETQAVRGLVEESGKISSAMNFHAWGNLWITPFCYSADPDYQSLMDPYVYRFYREFEAKIRRMGYTKSGNAEETIQYVANGEASDWMLGEHGIISFSPELGDDTAEDDVFYPSKAGILKVLGKEYPVIQLFLDSNVPLIKDRFSGFVETTKESIENRIGGKSAHLGELGANLAVFEMGFVNEGIVDLRDVRVVLNVFDERVLGSLAAIEVDDGKDRTTRPWNVNVGLKELTPAFVLHVRKLSRFGLRLYLREKMDFEFVLRVIKGGLEVARVSNIEENSVWDLAGRVRDLLLSTAMVIVWVMTLLAALLLAVWLVCMGKKERQKQRIIEMISERTIDL